MALFDELKTEIPFAFIVVADGIQISESRIIKEANELVRKEIGPFSSLGGGLVVQKLPKT